MTSHFIMHPNTPVIPGDLLYGFSWFILVTEVGHWFVTGVNQNCILVSQPCEPRLGAVVTCWQCAVIREGKVMGLKYKDWLKPVGVLE